MVTNLEIELKNDIRKKKVNKKQEKYSAVSHNIQSTPITVLKNMRCLKPWAANRGYLKIFACKNGKRKHYDVHRFVYECFRGDILPELQVDHIDNDRQNNCIDNLQLLTPAANCQKAPVGNRVGRKPRIPVISICVETGERKTVSSMNAAACALRVNPGCIFSIVRNKARSTQLKTNRLWYTFKKA